MRRLGLSLVPHGVKTYPGGRTLDYRGAVATAAFPTFYRGFVRNACPRVAARRVVARTADVIVRFPRVTWSASLSSSTFLVARTPRGWVAWARMH